MLKNPPHRPQANPLRSLTTTAHPSPPLPPPPVSAPIIIAPLTHPTAAPPPPIILLPISASVAPTPSSTAPSASSSSPPSSSTPPMPSHTYSDISSARPYWREVITAWSAADPSRIQHCNRILDYLENGLPIDPVATPSNIHLPNTPLVAQHHDAVRTQLDYYLAMGAVEECIRADIDAVHPLHCVIKTEKKLRVVVDFSINLNNNLIVPPMQYASSIDAAVAGSKKGCWYSKLDIKDCFLSFKIREGAERLLGFQFDRKFYRYRRLPFGLNVAPEFCEAMLSVVSYQLTKMGITHVRYCDDILIIAPSKVECDRMTTAANAILHAFGFAVAHHKTIWSVQIVEFLGVLFYSINETLSCPKHRIDDLLIQLKRASSHGAHHVVQFIYSLVGKLSFAAHVLPGARPFFRSLIDATRGLTKRSIITLEQSHFDDINYWIKHLSTWNGRQKWRAVTPITIATDASLVGWGGLVIASPVALPTQLAVGSGTSGVWCEQHPINSSSDIGWAELFAVLFMVASIAPHAPNSTIKILVDNQADAFIINRQSTRSSSLLSLLRSLYSVATEHNLSLIAQHIPGTSNIHADALSRHPPLPSPLTPVTVCCSCVAPPTMVRWCHPSSPSSNGTRCGRPPRAPTPMHGTTSNGSAQMPTATTNNQSANNVYVKPPSTSAVNDRSTASHPTYPRSSGGSHPTATRNYRAPGYSHASRKAYSMSTDNSISKHPPTRLPLINATVSYPTSTYGRSTTRATGAHSHSRSSVYYGLASTPRPHYQQLNYDSNMLPQPAKASRSPFHSVKPHSLQPPFASAPAPTSSARSLLTSTTRPSSVAHAPRMNHSSLLHHHSTPRPVTPLIHSHRTTSSVGSNIIQSKLV